MKTNSKEVQSNINIIREDLLEYHADKYSLNFKGVDGKMMTTDRENTKIRGIHLLKY